MCFLIYFVSLIEFHNSDTGWASTDCSGAELGDGLGALSDGVLGELTGEEEPDGGLDFPGGDGGPLVVVGKTGGLGGNALKDVVHEGVHDGHGLGADASVGVDLLQDLVDVDRVRFLPLLTFLLAISLGDGLGGLTGLLGGFSGGLGRHVVRMPALTILKVFIWRKWIRPFRRCRSSLLIGRSLIRGGV